MELEKLQEDEERLQQEIRNLSNKLNSLRQEKIKYQEELEAVRRNIEIINSEITVTDHAVVRYFERVLNFNIDEIRDKICPLDIKNQIKVLSNCKCPVADFEIVAKNNKIVTVQK